MERSDSSHKRRENRMKRPAIDGPDLRLEQRCKEKRVLREFDRLNTSIIGPRSDREPMSREALDICRRESEATPMKTHEGCTAAERMHPSSWNGGHGTLLPDEAAVQPINHERPPARSRLGVIGITETGDVPSKLDDGVLKTAACCKEWLPGCPGHRDSAVHRVVVAIWATGHDPQPICVGDARRFKRVGPDPKCAYAGREQLQCGIDFSMSEMARIAIPEKSNLLHGVTRGMRLCRPKAVPSLRSSTLRRAASPEDSSR